MTLETNNTQESTGLATQRHQEALTETLWGKPAHDIITGIEKNDNVQQERPIWELVQNARDVAIIESNIEFIRNENTFVFEHNGMPFNYKTMLALIIQTSSKERDDNVQAGQYGTGFLTTHKFGLKIELSGSLKPINNKDEYLNFADFKIDRSTRDDKEMATNLKEQNDECYNFIKKYSLDSLPTKKTCFKYIQDCKIEIENTLVAFQSAPRLCPFVLALNEKVKSISFIDNIYNKKKLYTRISSEVIDQQTEYIVEKISVKVEDNNEKIDKQIYVLKSINRISSGESEISIILPIKDTNNSSIYEVIEYNNDIPRLFLYLPLIGTEDWGVNFIIHSMEFTCEEARDKLRFKGNGQNNDDIAEKNRNLINKASDLIFTYIDNNIDRLNNAKYLAEIHLNYLSEDTQLSNFYQSLQTKWTEKFETLSLVNVGDDVLIEPHKIHVLSQELYEAASEDISLIPVFYRLLSIIYPKTIPIESDLLFWSKTILRWYKNEENSHLVTAEKIAEYIHKNPLAEKDFDTLLLFDKYLVDNRLECLLDYKLIPSVNNVLLIKNELVLHENISQTILDALKVLTPDEVAKFVHPEFSHIIAFTKYDVEFVKKALSSKFSLLIEDINKLNNELKTQNHQIDKDNLLNKNQIIALVDYCNALIVSGGDSFEAKIIQQICDYYLINSTVSRIGEHKQYEYRTALRLLIINLLVDFALSDEKKQTEKFNFILNVVKDIHGYSEFQNLLKDYKVYPDQCYQFNYPDSLNVEKEMPSALKSMYNNIFSANVEEKLVHKDFEAFFLSKGELQGQEIANELFNQFKEKSNDEEPEYPDISKNKYQSYILDIIEHISNNDDSRIWEILFSEINHKKEILMMSRIQDENVKKSMFKIIRIDEPEKLKKIADLLSNDDFDDIIKLGKEELKRKNVEASKVQYKKQLGKYVEDMLLKELDTKLDNLELKVIEEQGGQDLLVKLNGEIIYYIEIKSRWISNDSVLMSSLQMKTSAEHPKCYALCAVDMISYNRGLVTSNNNIFPPFEETKDRIRVLVDIGTRNAKILPAKANNKNDVYLSDDYKSTVPQELIKSESGKEFSALIDTIKEKVEAKLN